MKQTNTFLLPHPPLASVSVGGPEGSNGSRLDLTDAKEEVELGQ